MVNNFLITEVLQLQCFEGAGIGYFIIAMQSNKAAERNLRIQNIRNTLRAVAIIHKTTLHIQSKILKQTKKNPCSPEALSDKNIGEQTSQTQSEEQANNLFNDHYTVAEKIGEGAHGVVRKCYCKQSGELLAVKTFKVEREHIIFLKHNFIDIKKLQHPNIIAYKALFFEMQNQKCHLVMDYLPFPDLLQIHIKTEHRLKELTHELLKALDYVHSHKICHRDIKPQNVLYDQNENKIILIDFGISRKLTTRGIKRDMLTLTGTPYYRAPEMFEGGGYDQLVDIWALGVTIFKLMAGYTPFESEYHSETIANIMKGEVTFPPQVEARFSRQARIFVSRLLRRRNERITAKEALNDLWFIDLEKMAEERKKSLIITCKLQKHDFHLNINVPLLVKHHTGTEEQQRRVGLEGIKSREETIKQLKCLDQYAEEEDSKIYGCPEDYLGSPLLFRNPI